MIENSNNAKTGPTNNYANHNIAEKEDAKLLDMSKTLSAVVSALLKIQNSDGRNSLSKHNSNSNRGLVCACCESLSRLMGACDGSLIEPQPGQYVLQQESSTDVTISAAVSTLEDQQEQLALVSLRAAASLCSMAQRCGGPSKGKTRLKLRSIIESSLEAGNSNNRGNDTNTASAQEAEIMCVILLMSALSLSVKQEPRNNENMLDTNEVERHQALSRAVASAVLPVGRYNNTNQYQANRSNGHVLASKRQRRNSYEEAEKKKSDQNNLLPNFQAASVTNVVHHKHEGNKNNQELYKQQQYRKLMAQSALLELLRTLTKAHAPAASEVEITVDVHIVTSLARAFLLTPLETSSLKPEVVGGFNNEDKEKNRTATADYQLAKACVTHLRQTFQLPANDNNDDNNNNYDVSPSPSMKLRTTMGSTDDNINISENCTITKNCAAAALGLSSIICPFEHISPVPLVHHAMKFHLWHAAERICQAAANQISLLEETQPHPSTRGLQVVAKTPSSRNSKIELETAVQFLISTALSESYSRQADLYATTFYDFGGKPLFAIARVSHAKDTISKIMKKRQLPIIERQVERVDRAYERVYLDTIALNDDNDDNGTTFTSTDDGRKTADVIEKATEVKQSGQVAIRIWALSELRRAREHDGGKRLADIWNMEYQYNTTDAKKDEEERKLTYLQWDEMSDLIIREGLLWNSNGSDDSDVSLLAATQKHQCIPVLVSDADGLHKAFQEMLLPDCANTSLRHTIQNQPLVIGFDTEWGDDNPGTGLLQLSTIHKSILIDIPALSMSIDGATALRSTVGRLFAGTLFEDSNSSNMMLVGFEIKEDLSRLAKSPCVFPPIPRSAHIPLTTATVKSGTATLPEKKNKNNASPSSSSSSHWLSMGTSAAYDLKSFIAQDTSTEGVANGGSTINSKLNGLGLSRCTQYYFGKRLDKSEQCSHWTQRPLTHDQRVYAALDAWICAAIYTKLITKRNFKQD
eukprot:CAMPEP_0194372764 /NCGR_PEP_ID=MMETSP0174-20130528/21150_1 /TAXON_ID=216777 /ORGANISM="Proboscia alata, Strain PI-D3" /LENGTH=980 /DNA_ID=CAMNT_0039151467 /DNA_START=360 /DNA_END=3302 /DNA_ORIENTATION=-